MADRKISDLTALTTPASGDYLPIVDISEAAAASKNKRITIEELFRGVPLGTAAAPSIAVEGDENTGIYSPGADQVAISTNGTGRLFVDASGNVGLGTSTPGEKLDISSGTSGTAAVVKIRDPAGRVLQIASPSASTEAYIGTTTNHRLDFYTNNTVKATLDASGRLLVGTSTARDKFFNTTWAPTLQVENAGAGARGVSIVNNDSGDNTPVLNFGKANGTSIGSTTLIGTGNGFGLIAFQGSDGTEMVPGAYISAAADGTPAANSMPGRLVFSTTADGASSPTERVRIDRDGNVFWGPLSGANYPNYLVSDGTIRSTATYNTTTASAANVFISSVGVIARSTSSIKYKSDVKDADYGLAELLSLRPVTYKGLNDGETVFGGLIAEEVDAAGLSEFVQYAEDGTPDALAYGNMVSLCIKAIQEQQTVIAELQTKVAALEAV